MENYEKKYKEALEVIKDNLDALNEITETGANVVNIQSIKNCFYRAFPEIKEPEDDGIRKELIRHFKGMNFVTQEGAEKVTRWIAWLGKQGKQKTDIPKWKYKKDNAPLSKDCLILNRYGCVVKSVSGAMVSDAWVLDYDELAKLPKEEVEKQDEKPQIEAKDYSSIDPLFFKTTDKIESKFKLGDWVVYDHMTYQVVELPKEGYINLGLRGNGKIEFAPSSYCRYWTIEDAKDGDVLSNGRMVVIFKEFEEPSYREHIVAYVGLDEIGVIQITDGTWELGTDKVNPATKEQRDLLFQKMKKKGYTFDFEKKELKKIEQNSAWSEEDDYNVQCLAAKVTSDIQNGNVGRNQELIDWLKSLKQRIGG